MAILMIKCPVTGHAVSTGIDVEVDTFVQLPNVSSEINCPVCGSQHIWQKSDAWLTNGSMTASDPEPPGTAIACKQAGPVATAQDS